MSAREPFFAGLVYNEEGLPARTAYVGADACYAIPDGDFLRHVDAVEVDRQVLARIKEYLLSIKDVVIEGVMQMLGSDDPFTRAAIEMNLEKLEQILDVPPGEANIDELRTWLWMTGFRVVVDVHGQVVQVEMPGMIEGEE
jgi:hypothetical protein